MITKEQLNETLVKLNQNQIKLDQLAKQLRDNILANDAKKCQIIELIKTLETNEHANTKKGKKTKNTGTENKLSN